MYNARWYRIFLETLKQRRNICFYSVFALILTAFLTAITFLNTAICHYWFFRQKSDPAQTQTLLFGYTAASALSITVFDLVLVIGISSIVLYFYRRQSGKMAGAVSRIVDDTGKTCGAIETILDITKQKKHQQEIELKNQFLNQVLDSLCHPFYVINVHDYSIAVANAAARENMDAKPNCTCCYQISHNSESPCTGTKHECIIEKIKRSRKAETVEHVHYDKD